MSVVKFEMIYRLINGSHYRDVDDDNNQSSSAASGSLMAGASAGQQGQLPQNIVFVAPQPPSGPAPQPQPQVQPQQQPQAAPAQPVGQPSGSGNAPPPGMLTISGGSTPFLIPSATTARAPLSRSEG